MKLLKAFVIAYLTATSLMYVSISLSVGTFWFSDWDIDGVVSSAILFVVPAFASIVYCGVVANGFEDIGD